MLSVYYQPVYLTAQAKQAKLASRLVYWYLYTRGKAERFSFEGIWIVYPGVAENSGAVNRPYSHGLLKIFVFLLTLVTS